MKSYVSVLPDEAEATLGDPEGGGQSSEDDLWLSRLVPDFN